MAVKYLGTWCVPSWCWKGKCDSLSTWTFREICAGSFSTQLQTDACLQWKSMFLLFFPSKGDELIFAALWEGFTSTGLHRASSEGQNDAQGVWHYGMGAVVGVPNSGTPPFSCTSP